MSNKKTPQIASYTSKLIEVQYRVIQKEGLNFVRPYFLNYMWYVNDLHNI